MWDGFLMLLSLSLVMAFASFLAGSLPLSFSLSRSQLRFISALGTGVLVGTALIVIIPEGVETLYSAGESHTPHVRRAGTLPSLSSLPIRESAPVHWPESYAQLSRDVESTSTRHKYGNRERTYQGLDEARINALNERDGEDGQPSTQPHSKREPHGYVGVSLVLGFILMYLIDVLPSQYPSQAPSYRPLQISLSNLSRGLHNSSVDDLPSSPLPEEDTSARPASTSIGLIIHAIADGIALGASTTGPSSRTLGLVVFLAIMLHKAPAAFGLTSILLKEGVSKQTARTHLAVFSLAAPFGAFATWTAVNLLGISRLGGDEGMTFATGCVLLFSGGTFLYVAFHSMQESHGSPYDGNGPGNGYREVYSSSQRQQQPERSRHSIVETATVVFGMLLPLVTQIGHAHAH